MKRKLFGILAIGAIAGLLALGCAGAQHKATPGGVVYKVSMMRMWSPQSHPFEYPMSGVTSGHFSGWIGASHSEKYVIFKEGGMATPGLQMLSEMGKHTPLDSEIQAAITAGTAAELFETSALQDISASVESEVQVSDNFPMVSVVAMIAPSPCWFAGAPSVNLKQDGKWVPTKTMMLYAYNAGTDDGMTYTAKMAAKPWKPIKMADTPHFVKDGKKIPVATITFTKM